MSSTADKVKGTTNEAVGKAKQGLGKATGSDRLEGEGAIVPVVVGESVKSKAISQDLLAGGLLATSFSFPVVPEGAARIRFQVSQSHSESDLKWAADLIASTFNKRGATGLAHS